MENFFVTIFNSEILFDLLHLKATLGQNLGKKPNYPFGKVG